MNEGKSNSVQKEMVSPFSEIKTAPQMSLHARLFFERTGESAALAAAAKVDLMMLQSSAEHSA